MSADAESRSYPPLAPYLTVSNAEAAIAFYVEAFGAEEVERALTPDGQKIMHAEVAVNGGTIMLSDDIGDDPAGTSTPEALGGSTVTIHLSVGNAEALWERAVAAGAEVTMPLAPQFWGALYGRLRDPFGHHWSLISEIAPVSNEDLREGAAEAFPEHADG